MYENFIQYKENFTWIGKTHIPPDEQGDQHDMTIFKDVSFIKSLKDTVNYFGGSQNFINYWTWFRASMWSSRRLISIKKQISSVRYSQVKVESL